MAKKSPAVRFDRGSPVIVITNESEDANVPELRRAIAAVQTQVDRDFCEGLLPDRASGSGFVDSKLEEVQELVRLRDQVHGRPWWGLGGVDCLCLARPRSRAILIANATPVGAACISCASG